MNLIGNIAVNLYSFIILLVLYSQVLRKGGRGTLSDRLFLWLLHTTTAMLILDTLGRFDGQPGTFYSWFNAAGNFGTFFLDPILPALWLMYVHAQIRQDEKRTLRLVPFCVALVCIHTAVLIATQFTGWLYSIDAGNVYHRGPLFLFSTGTSLLFLTPTTYIILDRRKKMTRTRYISFLVFPILPLVATATIYGISFLVSGVVISILIIFLNIQNRSMVTDYLTSAYNRKGLDMHLREKIRLSAGGRGFSAILLDYDHFKAVNDTFGHDTGDLALQISAELLRGCVRTDDFVARFGGDEFVILLNTANPQELKSVVNRINQALDRYNREGGRPFKISFSAGYAVYDPASRMRAEDFVKHLDQMMYQMKHQDKPDLPVKGELSCSS